MKCPKKGGLVTMEGVPLIMIRDLLGHSTIKMTERYAHLAPSPLAEAVPLLLRAEERALAMYGQPVGSREQNLFVTTKKVPSFQV